MNDSARWAKGGHERGDRSHAFDIGVRALGDTRNTLPIFAVPGQDELAIVGTNTLREDLHIDPLLPPKEIFGKGGNAVGQGVEDPHMNSRGRELMPKRQVQVIVETLQEAVAGDVSGSDGKSAAGTDMGLGASAQGDACCAGGARP